MASRGYGVFPLKPNSKNPYEKHDPEKQLRGGIHKATTDRETILQWFAFRPDINYGVHAEGLAILDYDPKRSKTPEQWLEDRAGLGPMPVTLTVATPSGGFHEYYRPAEHVGQRDLAETIDVRGAGGYVVGPGSVFKGRTYRIHRDAPVAALPSHVEVRCSRPGKKAGDREPIGQLDSLETMARALQTLAGHATVTEGRRDNECYKVACTVQNLGVSEPELLTLMQRFNLEKCDPPLEDGDIERITSSAYRNSQRAPGSTNAANDFEYISAEKPTLAEKPAPDDKAEPKRKLLEFPSEIRLEDLVRRQSNALVKGVLHAADAAVLYGESTAGKSFVGLDMAWHLALGKLWHGRKVNKVPVLYVALEGVDGFRKRMLALVQFFGDPGVWFARLNIHVSLVKAEAGKEGVKAILAAAAELSAAAGQPVGAVVIDTYSRATAGDDENAADDVMSFVEKRAGVIIRKTGASVVTVAHTNRSGDLRGSLHLGNAADVVLKVKRDGRGRKLIGEKVKDGEQGPLFDFTLQQVHLGTDEDGEPVTSCRVESTPPKPSAIAQKEPITVRVLRAAYQAVCAEQQRSDVLLADVRDEFTKRYSSRGERDPKKMAAAKRNAWHMATRSLPKGLELFDREGSERVRAVGATSPDDEFEPVEAGALEALDSSRT